MKLRRFFRMYAIFFGLFMLVDEFIHFTQSQPLTFLVFLIFLMVVWITIEVITLGVKSNHPFDMFFESKKFALIFRVYIVFLLVVMLIL